MGRYNANGDPQTPQALRDVAEDPVAGSNHHPIEALCHP